MKATLKELRKAYREEIEAKIAYTEAKIALDKFIYALPEVKAIDALYKEWQRAYKALEDAWLKK